MKVLLIDRSGRGHAFVDLFTRTHPEVIVHYAPGCAAAAGERVVVAQHLSLADPRPMIDHARREEIDLVFVANTQALADGFVDAFRAAGLAVVGPDAASSRLESSKVYAKALFDRYAIPSPDYAVFDDPAAAHDYVRKADHQVVVKADGLCGGNGAFVCDDESEAFAAIDRLLVERFFGEAGSKIVVERRLFGPEISIFALFDGRDFLLLPTAQDYPKSDDGGRGVTSGGMGAISPHPFLSRQEEILSEVEASILGPLAELIAAEDLPYRGVIYLGCMLADDRPHLLEINARMGDPEAEVVLPQIENDFVELSRAMLEGRLAQHRLRLDGRTYCDVVATQGPTPARRPGDPAGGFPGWPFGDFARHLPIHGLERIDRRHCRVFLGEATVLVDGRLVSDGGRVVHVVGVGHDAAEAARNSYAQIPHLQFEGMRYRGDIGGPPP